MRRIIAALVAVFCLASLSNEVMAQMDPVQRELHDRLDRQMRGDFTQPPKLEAPTPLRPREGSVPQAAVMQPAAVAPQLREQRDPSGEVRVENHVTPWMMAATRPGKEAWNYRVGFADIEVLILRNNSFVEAAVPNKLPRDYGMRLLELHKRGRVENAACSHVAVIFSNLGETPLPRIAVAVKSRHGSSHRLVATFSVAKVDGNLGFLSTLIPLEQTDGGRPLRLPFPNQYLERVPQPVVTFKVYDEKGEVPIMYLPAGADDQNAMISLPRNEKYGSENDLHLAVKNGGRLFTIVVPPDRCKGGATS